jgi:hypothetical protein
MCMQGLTTLSNYIAYIEWMEGCSFICSTLNDFSVAQIT